MGKIWVSDITNGGYAFLQVSFTKGGYYDWVKWIDSEYINETTNGWVDVYVSGIAPSDADHIQISCRVRAMNSGGYVNAYFDDIQLISIAPVSYDGNSIALAWGQGWNPDPKFHLNFSAVQLTQNVTFTDLPNDTNRIWSFSCKIAVVQDHNYSLGISDWKGVFISVAFANSSDFTDPNTKWLTWMDDTYLSFDSDFTQLTIRGIPPSNAKALVLIIKVRLSVWGVLFMDDPHLTYEPMVIPKDYSVPSTISDAYTLTLTVQSINGTSGMGKLNCGSLKIISTTNCTSSDSTFTFQVPNTSNTLTLTFNIGVGTLEVWLPVMLALGLFGAIMLTVAPVYFIEKAKGGDWDDALCWGMLMFIIGFALVIAWLWS
jgi:hypothetical protein